jgi:hypothetical protein
MKMERDCRCGLSQVECRSSEEERQNDVTFVFRHFYTILGSGEKFFAISGLQ